ncbi:phage baseplate assembly protein V [Streptomyces sp. NPDC002730]|uniref:phage baseplate assembly protein V n=1 Tax=Streptomyces sp. NPDC002730 TaxID=3364662 RepID=UPI00368DD436
MTGMPGPAVDKRYFGVMTGVVERVEDDPEKECRVQLSLPWFDGATITEWCRVAQPYAGNGYGASFVPEKGDEVLVAFDQGDMRFPIVIGCLYNGVDKPPTHRSGSRDEKLLRTKHGHELALDDSSGKEAVRLTSSAGHRIELDDAGSSVVVRTASGGKVTVTADGSVEISAGSGPVTVTGGSVTLDAPQVKLGTGTSEPVLPGTTFEDWFRTHTHPVVSPVATGPVTYTGPAPMSTTVQVAL